MSNNGARWLLIPLSLLLMQGGLAQGDGFDTVEISVHQVRGSIHYLEGRGGNVGLSVGEDGVVMIDSQFAPLAERIVSAIRTVSDGDIRFLINTHVHGDHIGGNENIASLGVPIVAHDNVRLRMVQGVRGGPPEPRRAWPALTYGDSVMLHLNGEDIEIFVVPPAHTDGDSYIHFHGSDVLHLGDVFRTTGYPVIDLESGGTLRGTLEALQVAIDRSGPDTRIIPGHGNVSTRDDVREFRDMIIEVEQRVSALVEQGMTLEQVLAEQPTADLDERWGSPERFLPALYQALQDGT